MEISRGGGVVQRRTEILLSLIFDIYERRSYRWKNFCLSIKFKLTYIYIYDIFYSLDFRIEAALITGSHQQSYTYL